MENWNRRTYLKMLGASTLGMAFSPSMLSVLEDKEIATEGTIKRLLYNENPDGPSGQALSFIQDNLSRSNRYCTFHQYDFQALKQLIAAQEGLHPDNILLGHGSFEPLTWLAIHFGENKGEIIVPSPSFDVVGAIARTIGANVRPIEVDASFQMNLPSMEAAITPQTKLLTLCNPNNPTGQNLAPELLKAFVEKVSSRCPVLIDEAYIHYLEDWREQTMSSLIAADKNVLITRTFSKIYGMAGLRIGFLMGPSQLISQLERRFTMGFPGNMPNTLSVAAAIGALKDDQFVAKARRVNELRKIRVYESLERLQIPYLKSATNFVYFKVQDFQAFKSYMRQEEIILAGGWPTKPDWARVTIGSDDELTYFTERLQTKSWLKD